MSGPRKSWNKWLYMIHGWLGLNFGLVLFIVCLSGTFAVVSHEIDWLLTPSLRVTPQESRASYGEMHEAVREAYPDAPARIAWAPVGPRFACEFWLPGERGGTRRVYVDPYTARIQGEAPWFNTQRFFRDFHRRFFWSAWWGIWLVAVFGFVLLGSSATGLMFYKRWWAKLFVLRWGKAGRLFWSDLHRTAGVWTLLFSLLISLTGIWYFVEIPLHWKIKSPRLPRVPEASLPADAESESRLPVDEWVRIAEERIPGFEVGALWFPQNPKNPVRIDGQASAWLVRDRANKVVIDPYTGEVLFAQRAEQLGPLARWEDTADPLHFGNFAGLTSKLVWFVFGLALSALMPTGAYLWVRRAAQIANSTDRRFRGAAGALRPQERMQLVRWVTRRQTAFGVQSTTAVLLLAGYATYSALAKQIAEVDSASRAVSQLGGSGTIFVLAAFVLLMIAATALWYRYVWFRNHGRGLE